MSIYLIWSVAFLTVRRSVTNEVFSTLLNKYLIYEALWCHMDARSVMGPRPSHVQDKSRVHNKIKTSLMTKQDHDNKVAGLRRGIKFLDLFNLINLEKLTFSSFVVMRYSSVWNSKINWQLIPAFYMISRQQNPNLQCIVHMAVKYIMKILVAVWKCTSTCLW